MVEEANKLREQIAELETRLTIALLSANQVWWEWDIPTGHLGTHSVRECILGYDHSKITPHYDFWIEAVHPDDREIVEHSLRDHHEGLTEFWAIEHRYRDPNGEYKWVLNAGKVVSFDSAGKPLRMIETSVECCEQLNLSSDRFSLFRILDNLAGNAIKFTEKGSILLSAKLEGKELIIKVDDTGTGIPETKRNLLFMPFSKFTSNPEGSGLGLSICKNLTQRLGGKISYRAKRDQGSIFAVSLPSTVCVINSIPFLKGC